MKTIIEHKNSGADFDGALRAEASIGADEDWRNARQQQRFIADMARVMMNGTDQCRRGVMKNAAISAREESWACAERQQSRRQRHRQGRFTIAAAGEAANDNRRQRGAWRRALQTALGDCAIERGGRREQR